MAKVQATHSEEVVCAYYSATHMKNLLNQNVFNLSVFCMSA